MRPMAIGGCLLGCLLVLGLTGPLLCQEPSAGQPYPAVFRPWNAEGEQLRGPVQWAAERADTSPQTGVTPAVVTAGLAEAAPAPPVPPIPLTDADPAAAPPARNEEATEYFTLDQLKAEMQSLVWTKGDFRIVPYGTLWANAVYETHRTFTGDYTLYVLPNRANEEQQVHLDARSTRLGFDLAGPQIPWFGGTAVTGGKVEIDFQRQIDTENKPAVLLRHAYLEVKNDDFRLLAGQTWDVISPLNPGMLMYSVGWDGGNIGYRRAQFRGERYLALSDESLLTLQGSINTDIITENNPPSLVGDHAGWPLLEGRVATTLGERGPGCLPVEIGVSGHIGEQVYDFAAPYPSPVIGLPRRTWSANIDVRVPISPRFGVQAEAFKGENLGTFLGGDGQGIDAGTPTAPGTRRSIRSQGGWFDVWYDWTPRFHTHSGYSIDDPYNQDVTTGRVYNAFFFQNFIFDVTPKFLVGIEISSWKTHWVSTTPTTTPGDAESVHTDFVAKYSF